MLYKIVRIVGLFIFKVLYRCEVINADEIPKDTPLVICSNHKSNLDPLFISANIKFQIHWMAKNELWKIPFLGFLITKLGGYPVDRNTTDIKAIKTSMKLLKEKEAIGIFIEGTRVKEIDYSNAKSGAAVIAHRSSAIVVPVYVEGNYMPFKKMKLIVREPMDIRSLPKQSSEQYDEIAVDILKAIYSGVEKNRS